MGFLHDHNAYLCALWPGLAEAYEELRRRLGPPNARACTKLSFGDGPLAEAAAHSSSSSSGGRASTSPAPARLCLAGPSTLAAGGVAVRAGEVAAGAAILAQPGLPAPGRYAAQGPGGAAARRATASTAASSAAVAAAMAALLAGSDDGGSGGSDRGLGSPPPPPASLAGGVARATEARDPGPVQLVLFHLSYGGGRSREPKVAVEARSRIVCPFCTPLTHAMRCIVSGTAAEAAGAAAVAAALAAPPPKVSSLDGLACGPGPKGLMRHLAATHGDLLRCAGRRDLRDPTVFHVAVERIEPPPAAGDESGARSGGEDEGAFFTAAPDFEFVGPRRRVRSSAPRAVAPSKAAEAPRNEAVGAAPEAKKGGKRRSGPAVDLPADAAPTASTTGKRLKAGGGCSSTLSSSSSSTASASALAAAACAVRSAEVHTAAAARVAALMAAATASGGGGGSSNGSGIGSGIGNGVFGAAPVGTAGTAGRSGAACLPVRQYYHSRTGVPMRPHEMDIDSDGARVGPGTVVVVAAMAAAMERGRERIPWRMNCTRYPELIGALRCYRPSLLFSFLDYMGSYFACPLFALCYLADEIDEEWAVALSEKLIDEFEDVSGGEKLFMKLWNRHMRSPAIFADSQLPDACHHFAAM